MVRNILMEMTGNQMHENGVCVKMEKLCVQRLQKETNFPVSLCDKAVDLLKSHLKRFLLWERFWLVKILPKKVFVVTKLLIG